MESRRRLRLLFIICFFECVFFVLQAPILLITIDTSLIFHDIGERIPDDAHNTAVAPVRKQTEPFILPWCALFLFI
jgi:hypothetical protein